MYRGDVPGLSLGLLFTCAVMFSNIFWIIFYIYRIIVPDTLDNCDGVIWFYASYGRYLSCCCIVLLVVAFPKRSAHLQNYLSVQRTLMVAKVIIFGSSMFIINNSTLIIEIVISHPEIKCIGTISAVICHITFVLCWFSLFVSGWYVLSVLKDRSHSYLNLPMTNTTRPPNMEMAPLLT